MRLAGPALLHLLVLVLLMMACGENVKRPDDAALIAHLPIILVALLIVGIIDAAVLYATYKRHGS